MTLWPPYHCGAPLLREKWQLFERNYARLIALRGVVTMQSAYASWVGQAVVLQVAAGDLRVPLRGVIVGESDGAVRFRIGEGWDIDIYKPMILAVEQDNWASIIMN